MSQRLESTSVGPATAPSRDTPAGEAQVLVVGEALVDVVHRVDGRVDETPGGSPANVALALGRLGRAPLLLTALGDDDRGGSISSWLETSGVRVVVVPGERTASATARLDAHGSATYDFDIAWDLSGAPDIAAGILHVGSISALLEPGATHVMQIARRLRPFALVTYDPNVRPALLPDASAARRRVEEFVATADVVKASDEDLRWLYPGQEPHEVATSWLSLGPAMVAVTTGAEGAFAVTAAGRATVEAPMVDVVDTVGAGDTFMGAIIDGLMRAGLCSAAARTELRSMEPATLRSILHAAARAAAITVSRPGADPPTREDLLARSGI